jgi:hypothetical protein
MRLCVWRRPGRLFLVVPSEFHTNPITLCARMHLYMKYSLSSILCMHAVILVEITPNPVCGL